MLRKAAYADWLQAGSTSRILATCIAIAIFLIQAIPLFWRVHFYYDWTNHVWIVNYYAHYLKAHHSFPVTVDVDQEFGSPLPVFYGVFLYPTVSIIASVIGGDIAIRLVCIVLLALPLVLYGNLFSLLRRDWTTSILLASIICASPYQLTNLYMRNALTEFVAYQTLIVSIALIALGLVSRPRSIPALSLGMACLAFALGSHPITFYSVGLFCAPLAVTIAFSVRRHIDRRCLIYVLVWTVLGGAVLMPFVIAVLKYSRYLQIVTTYSGAGKFQFFPSSIDSLWGKLGVFFTDPRVMLQGIGGTSTPFLDAPFQIWLALAVMLFFLSAKVPRRHWWLAIPTLACMAAIIFMSHVPDGAQQGTAADAVAATDQLGIEYKLAEPIQFAYRLSSTMSICLIVTLVSILMLDHNETVEPYTPAPMRQILLVLALLASMGVVQKLYQSYVEFKVYPSTLGASEKQKMANTFLLADWQEYVSTVTDTSRYPPTFYGKGDYAMQGMLRQPPAEVVAKETPEVTHFRRGRPEQLSCESIFCYVRTNIAPSAFETILMDGTPATVFADAGVSRAVIAVPNGTHEVSTSNSGRLPVLLSASVLVMIGWLFSSSLALIIQLARSGMRRRNSGRSGQ